MLNNFIYAQEKSLFLEQLGAGNILDEAIVFIEDTGEIWNHGTYFAGDCGFDPEVIREIQTAVANLKASKQNAISDLATIRIGASAGATAVQPETLNNYVPTNRTINGKSLTNNISLSASDVGAPAIGELNTTNTNVSDLTSKVSSLTTDYSAFKQVFSDNSDEYINTWGEVKNFLDGIKNTEDLNNILLGINTQLGNKADKSQLSGYLPLSGGTLNGGLTVPTLTISSQDAVKHIAFSRAAVNYIHAPSGGYMAFIVNGQNVINANAEMIISDGIIYAGTDNVTQLGYGEKRWSGVYSYAGDFAGQITANTILASSVVACGGRLRINTSNSVNSFGFLKATAHTDALNRAVMHIGTNYGGSANITTESVDVVAMSIYRGVLGIGREYTYDELYANYNNAISLMVANNMSVKGSTYVNGNITTNSNIGIGTAAPTQKLDVRGNQYITGYIYADGDLHTGQWLKTSTGVAFGSAHTLTFNSYSIISNAELAFTNISTTDISTGIKAAIKAGLMQINDIIGHRIFLGNNTASTASNQPFSICTYSSVSNYAPANVTELFRVDPTGAVTINGSLSVTGNIISSDEYLGASNVLDNPEYASYPSSGSSMEMHSDIRNFVNNGTVVRKDGKLYVKDNPFAPVTTHWLDIFSDPTEIGGYNYSGPVELDLYPDRFYDFTNSLFISSIKINSIPGWDNPGLISHNIVRFRPTNTAFSLTLPSDIYWADGKPFEVDDNDAVYEMSFIVRNGGVITATWTKFTQA